MAGESFSEWVERGEANVSLARHLEFDATWFILLIHDNLLTHTCAIFTFARPTPQFPSPTISLSA